MACIQTMIPDPDGADSYGFDSSTENLGHSHPASVAGMSTNSTGGFRIIKTDVVQGVRGAHHNHTSELKGGRRHLVARPRALQFFHHRVLHRQTDAENEDVERQAGRFELFLDLLLVCIIANFSEDVIHYPDGLHVLKYTFSFIMVWQIWSYITFLMNSYYNDDLLQRVFILWMMSLIIFFSNNAAFIDTSLLAMRSCVGAYMLARFSFGLIYFMYSFAIGQHTVQLRALALAEVLHILLWIPCLLSTVSLRNKAIVALFALLTEQFTWIFFHGSWFRYLFKLSYSLALSIEHHIDRLAAFYIIVLGEFLYGLVFGSPVGNQGVSGGVARMVMVLVIAWSLCWLYTASDGAKNNPESATHAIRYKVWRAYLWFFLHLPLTASMVLAGDTLTIFVKEGNARAIILHKRAEEAAAAEGSHDSGSAYDAGKQLADDLRWLFCGCYALGMFCLWAISVLHHEHTVDDAGNCYLLFPKWLRRLPRLVATVIIACLPVASSDQLPNNSLLGICTALTAGCVLWEMFGAMAPGWTFVESGDREGRADCCQGKCQAMMDAEGVDCLDELMKCRRKKQKKGCDAEKGDAGEVQEGGDNEKTVKVTAKGGNQNILGDAE